MSHPAAPEESFAVLREAGSGRWLRFDRPLAVLTTSVSSDAAALLHSVEKAAADQKLWAVGWVAYEAASAFDSALSVRSSEDADFPLLWFGLFKAPTPVEQPASATPLPRLSDWRSSITASAYRQAFERIKRHIREGDVYQVNLTYRLRAAFEADPLAAFGRLADAQNADYAAFLSTPRWTLCSASPELFFRLDGTRIESRPMKGTAPRGLTLDQDRARAAALYRSEKERAENVMIADMVRNDLGRIAVPGSVSVPNLFAVEKYPTVWQMTTSVRAETHASVSDLFAALFPAASITGAPKNSAMHIIAAAESTPRRVYTGAIGFIAPGRRAQFNVAIRTLLIDRAARRAEYGVGGGIVWDSVCAAERAESLTKARILTAPTEPFSLLETLLWTPDGGVYLLAEHLARLEASAEYFDVPLDLSDVRTRLARLAEERPSVPRRVRLLVARDGAIAVESSPFTPFAAPLRIALARTPVNRDDPFLYHKTTRRRIYEEALASRPGFDDVVLFNAEGEITESTRANVVVECDGARCTPPVACGLLPGTLRRHLLETRAVSERIVTVETFLRSPRVWLASSLRGLRPAVVQA